MASTSTVNGMTVNQFADFLADRFDEDVVNVMKKNKIAGSTFLKLSEVQLERMIPAIGDVVELRELQIKIISQDKQASGLTKFHSDVEKIVMHVISYMSQVVWLLLV